MSYLHFTILDCSVHEHYISNIAWSFSNIVYSGLFYDVMWSGDSRPKLFVLTLQYRISPAQKLHWLLLILMTIAAV